MNTTKLTNAFTITEGMLVRCRVDGEVAQLTYGVRTWPSGRLFVTLATVDNPIVQVRLDIFFKVWAPLL